MEEDIERMGGQIGEVFFTQLFQGLNQGIAGWPAGVCI